MNIIRMIEESDFDPGDFNEWSSMVEEIDAIFTRNTQYKIEDKPEIGIILQKLSIEDKKTIIALVVLREFLLGRYADPVL